MSDSPSSTLAQGSDPLRRFIRTAWVILAILCLGALLFWRPGGAASVFIGGILALINFNWMKAGIDRALGRLNRPKTGWILIGYVGRFALILLGLFAIIHFSFLSLYGALLGLSIFVLAGIVEAILLMVRGLLQN
jgi:hypothetical protein